MTNLEFMKTIMEMYKFHSPMPTEVKKQALISRKKNLIVILKKFRRYGLLSIIAVNLFFLIKKAGITLTFIKSYVIAVIISATTVAVVATGSGIAVKKVLENHREETPKTIPQETEKTAEQPAVQETNSPAAPAIQYKVEIKPLTATGDLAPVAKKMTQELLRSMRAYNKESAFISGSEKCEAPYLLTGSVVKLGSLIIFNVRLINPNSSEVISVYSEKTTNIDDTESIAKTISKNILKKIY